MASLDNLQGLVGPKGYDAVVRIDRFQHVFDANLGWKLATAEGAIERLDGFSGVRVVPIGHFGAGKTWLIGKLCEGGDTQLASGTDVHTEGLSLKVAALKGQTKLKCAFLDTAGLNSPVTSIKALGSLLKEGGGRAGAMTGPAKMQAMQGMLEELKRHETFVRKVGFEFAQAFLMVVGQISHREQQDLLALIEEAGRSESAKQVIVVHNLKNMTYDSFKNHRDAETGMTYLEMMTKVFRMAARVTQVSNDESEVDELFGAFGVTEHGGTVKPKVHIRHVFVTNDNDPASKQRNHWVFAHIRRVIATLVPLPGCLLTTLGTIMTSQAEGMVRMPAGRKIEIRAHRGRGRMLAGEVTEEEQQEMAAAKSNVHDDGDVERKLAAFQKAEGAREAAVGAELDAARVAAEAAEEAYSQALAVAASRTAMPVRDASRLKLLDAKAKDTKVTCKDVPLGAVLARKSRSETQLGHTVTRVRGWVADIPHWVTSVHMVMPGLAAGEVDRIREQLAWEVGAVMVREDGAAEDTLQLRFVAKMLARPEKQLAVACTGAAGSKPLQFDRSPVQVVDAGSRPFPKAEADGSATPTAGQHEVRAVVTTKVATCIDDVAPVVVYSRGVLTVTVCCAVSEEDERDQPVAWTESEQAKACDMTPWQAGANGSDDDVAA